MISLEEQFQSQFGTAPTIRIEAPGRVNLIGEHIDYLDGWVMPAAIEPRITLLAAPGSDSGHLDVWTAKEPEALHTLSIEDFTVRTAPDETWLNYPIGVLGAYAAEGISPKPCRIGVFSTLPDGAGLSSSAAVETALALLVETLDGKSLSTAERALLCQKAEHEWVGVPCGIMDQLSVGAGVEDHVLQIDCQTLEVEPIPLPPEIEIIVADTGVKHALADGQYGKRRSDCEAALQQIGALSWREVTLEQVMKCRESLGNRLFLRARHAVTEMQRVQDFTSALKSNHREQLSAIMRAGHDSLRDDYEVSCPELDFLVDAGYEFGVEKGHIGSRMTGGGFGGSTIHLVNASAAEDYMAYLCDRHKEAFALELKPFATRASAGAHIAKVSR